MGGGPSVPTTNEGKLWDAAKKGDLEGVKVRIVTFATFVVTCHLCFSWLLFPTYMLPEPEGAQRFAKL